MLTKINIRKGILSCLIDFFINKISFEYQSPPFQESDRSPHTRLTFIFGENRSTCLSSLMFLFGIFEILSLTRLSINPRF